MTEMITFGQFPGRRSTEDCHNHLTLLLDVGLLHAKAKTVITTYCCHFHINGYRTLWQPSAYWASDFTGHFTCVCTVVLTSTFFSNSRHRGIIARKTWESQISLTNSKIPWLFSKFQISLTNYKIPWLFPDLEFPWLFPDQWQPCFMLVNRKCLPFVAQKIGLKNTLVWSTVERKQGRKIGTLEGGGEEK